MCAYIAIDKINLAFWQTYNAYVDNKHLMWTVDLKQVIKALLKYAQHPHILPLSNCWMQKGSLLLKMCVWGQIFLISDSCKMA